MGKWNYNISLVIEDHKLFRQVSNEMLHNNGLKTESRRWKAYNTSIAQMLDINIEDEPNKHVDIRFSVAEQDWCSPGQNKVAGECAPVKMAIAIFDPNIPHKQDDAMRKYTEKIYNNTLDFIKKAKSNYVDKDITLKLITDEQQSEYIHIYCTGQCNLHPLVWIW